MKSRVLSALGAGVLATAGFAAPALADAGPTLKEVQERGQLNCTGHNGSWPGFAEVDDEGNWTGLDVDLCRAVAVAIFGEPDGLNVVPVSWAQRWPSLQSGDVDLVIKASGGTFSRDNELGLQFSRPYYLGTTVTMTHKDLGVEKFADLAGGSVCVPAGTTIERQVAAYADRVDIDIEVVTFEKTEELREAYFSRRCDGYAQWGPTVGIARSVSDNPDQHIILDDVLALEPVVAVMRQGDDQWVDLVNWVFSALWFAEQEGINSDNVDEMKASPPNAAVGKVLGATPGVGKPLGLSDDWAYNVIKHMGNYGEVFARNIGKDSDYGMPRGLNNLWNEGGVHYPMVFD